MAGWREGRLRNFLGSRVAVHGVLRGRAVVSQHCCWSWPCAHGGWASFAPLGGSVSLQEVVQYPLAFLAGRSLCVERVNSRRAPIQPSALLQPFAERFHLLTRFDILAPDDGTFLAFLVVRAVEVCWPPLRRRLAVLAATGRSIRSAR